MIYTFQCEGCEEVVEVERSIKDGPPEPWVHFDDGVHGNREALLAIIVECPLGAKFRRVWEPVNFICRGDPDEIPPQYQTADRGTGAIVKDSHLRGPSKKAAQRKERAYQKYIGERRKLFRDNKQEGGRMTHQVPAELYHGKIRQTGDKNYWADESNLKRHKSCKVS